MRDKSRFGRPLIKGLRRAYLGNVPLAGRQPCAERGGLYAKPAPAATLDAAPDGLWLRSTFLNSPSATPSEYRQCPRPCFANATTKTATGSPRWSCSSTWCSCSPSPSSRTTLLEDLTTTGALRTLSAVPGGVVAVDLHLLGHQLARPRPPAGSRDAVRSDAGRAGAVLIDPAGLRGSGCVRRGAFAAMQVGRTLFVACVMRRCERGVYLSLPADRVVAYALRACSGCWAASTEGPRIGWPVGGRPRRGIHVAAALYFWVPRLAVPPPHDWDIDGRPPGRALRIVRDHRARRSRFSSPARPSPIAWNTWPATRVPQSPSSAAWRCGGSISTPAPSSSSRRIAQSDDPGRQGRLAYTYLHLLIIAGVIVSAVADELVLAHPHHFSGHENGAIATILGGPALYVHRQRIVQMGEQRPSRAAVLALRRPGDAGRIDAAGLLARVLAADAGHGGDTVLVFVAVWETIALRRE